MGCAAGRKPGMATNHAREVRHKTLQVAQQRVQTVLNRISPEGDSSIDVELAAALGKIGL